MEFVLLTEAQKLEYRDTFIKMIGDCDHEFVPPLSHRFSPSQTVFTPDACTKDGLPGYVDDMCRISNILCAFEGEEMLGFVAYRLDMTNQYLTAETLPNLYVAVLLVKPEARGRGITKQFYDHLFLEKYPDRNLYTRTWSTNQAHARILRRFGLEIVIRIENDRGEGIDTVYFGKVRA